MTERIVGYCEGLVITMDNAGVPDMAGRLLDFIAHVSADEFYRHDTHFNRDSRLGRELLYLIANDDWIRSTTEIINLTRGDSVDSLVKVNVDTSKITHEAFGENTGPLWLPLMVLTMPDRTGPVPSASPGQLTVVNQNGAVLAPMREGDVWHAISAALAEIFITLADNRWPWTDERKPGIDRDQRVLLSSAVFRLLSGTGRHIDSLVVDRGGHAGHADDSRYEESDSPLGEAKRKLTILMRRYFKAYTHPAQAGAHVAADTEALLLISRAAELLYAFTRAVVVVVEVDRSEAPAVLTATAPVRKLEDAPMPLHRFLRQLQPRARLEVDLLLPSGDADRQVEVAVPDDVSIDLSARRSRAATPGLDADVIVTVNPPPAEARLTTLMRSLLAEEPGPVQECLAGVAFTQADTLAQVLHQHLVLSAKPSDDSPLPGPDESYEDLYQRTDEIRHRLSELREQLRRVAASPSDPGAAVAELRKTWGDGSWLQHVLLRRASVSVPGPDTLTGRTALIENTRQRVAPSAAKVTVPVEVSDARFYSVARFSTAVSIVLTLVVLAFDVFGLFRPFKEAASPEVLASTLTLFAVIQAGRVEAPDRSTMRGRLTGAGNWLIIASVLPTIVLAIALAFVHSGWAPVWWALGAVAAQVLFLLAMWRGPLSAAGGHAQQPYRVLRTSPTPAYEKTGVLRAVWWQAATANALVLGRQAHGYLVWEHRSEGAGPGPQSLVPVLGRLQPGVEKTLALAKSVRQRAAAMAAERGDGDADVPVPNILAMMRSGTTRDAVTFVVLRDPPDGFPPDAVRVPLDIDPDRLTPAESPSEYIDVLVGVPGSGTCAPLRDHPVYGVLRAAKHQWLQVLETQLPVAPPTMSVREDLLWARVRIGFRDLDYGRIAHFLHEVAAIRCPVWVRSWPEHIPRSLRNTGDTGSFAVYGTRRELMTAQDFDVVSVAARHGADIHSRTWRMMAICVNTSFGVEYDLLGALAEQVPGLRLAAISHAELHGMDMFLVLGQVLEPGAGSGPDTAALEQALAGDVKCPTLKIVLDEWRTATELGFAEPGPLLRVDVRARDMPGTLQVVLDSLALSLRKRLPSLPEGDMPDWRVVLQTGLGHTARARLTMGLPVPDEEVHGWPPSRWAEIARDARAMAVRNRDGDFGVAENMVISVRPVRRKVPLPPPGSSDEGAGQQDGGGGDFDDGAEDVAGGAA